MMFIFNNFSLCNVFKHKNVTANYYPKDMPIALAQFSPSMAALTIPPA